MASLIGPGAVLAGELTWLDADSLESYLGSSQQATIPATQLMPRDHALCAAGSYAFDLPEGYRAAEHELQGIGALPVDEGSGLLFSLDGSRRLQDASELSVWPDALMLEVSEPFCLSAAAAQLHLRRDGRSIVIKLDDG